MQKAKTEQNQKHGWSVTSYTMSEKKSGIFIIKQNVDWI